MNSGPYVARQPWPGNQHLQICTEHHHHHHPDQQIISDGDDPHYARLGLFDQNIQIQLWSKSVSFVLGKFWTFSMNKSVSSVYLDWDHECNWIKKRLCFIKFLLLLYTVLNQTTLRVNKHLMLRSHGAKML